MKKSIFVRVCIALFATVFVCGFLFVAAWAGAKSGPDLRYKTWDFDAQVETNGDLRVRQIIDMQLDKRENDDDNGVKPWRQLYQQYTLESWQVTSLSNISVKNLSTGETYTQMQPQWNSPQSYTSQTWDTKYANHWYIADITHGDASPIPFDESVDRLQVSDSKSNGTSKKVEVGWNIPSTKSAKSMKFEVNMTFDNLVTSYNDVAKFQWSLFSATNGTPIGTVNANLHLPQGITQDKSWAWLHCEALSTTEKLNDGTLHFTAQDVRPGQYMDVVVMFPRNVMGATARTIDRDEQRSTIRTEDDKETAWRKQQQSSARMRLAIWVALILASAACSIGALIVALRSSKARQYMGPIEYWREPPQMSPAAAAQLNAVMHPEKARYVTNNSMSATVMSLVSKGALGVYPGASSRYRNIDMSRPDAVSLAHMIDLNQETRAKDRNTSTIVILPVAFSDRASLSLSPSEDAALDLLLKVSERIGCPVFDLRQMNKALKKYTNGYLYLRKFDTASNLETEALQATRSAGGWAITLSIIAIALALISETAFIVMGNAIALALCVSPVFFFMGALAFTFTYTKALTSPDNEYAGQVEGLKRYLEDFSDFSDRGVLDIALWDRYLVYATALGISGKALAQLVKAYPQVTDPQWLDANASSSAALFYWSMRPSHSNASFAQGPAAFGANNMSANFGDLGAQLSTSFSSISATIHAASPSSSGGSGGSFSSGGFGGGGGGGGGASVGGR